MKKKIQRILDTTPHNLAIINERDRELSRFSNPFELDVLITCR